MKNLDPKAKWFFLIPQMGFVVIIAVSGLFLGSISVTNDYGNQNQDVMFEQGTIIGIILLIAIVASLIAYLWAWLSWKNYKYDLTDSSFVKESGVINKKYTTINYERIQNVDIERNLLARLLGLSDLLIQTAGGPGMPSISEGRLPGLDKEEAIIIRDHLVEQSKLANNLQTKSQTTHTDNL